MPVRLRNGNGEVIEVPDDAALGYYRAQGYEPETSAQSFSVVQSEAARPEDRGALGSLNAVATGLLSGATLGLSDVALSGLLTDDQRARLYGDRQSNPVISGVSQVVGGVAPMLAAPGTLLGSAPAGIVGRASAAGFEAGRAAGGLAGVAQAAGATAVEGAMQSAGAYLADTALADRKLSAEGMFGAIGLGGTFGGVAGAAMLGIERGTIAARRMFARTANADKAAAEAEAAWTAAHQSTIEANDTAAEVAKAKLAQARVAREQADLAKQQASAFEADVRSAATDIDAYRQQFASDIATREQQLQRLALPAGPDIAPAPPSPAKLQELAEAVAEHDAARIDLDDLLRRLDAPDIEPGVASQVTVPRGQFDDLTQQGPLAQGTPVQVTTVGKKLGEGTPTGFETTAFDSKDLGLTFDPKTRTYHGEPIPPREAAPVESATGVFDRPAVTEQSALRDWQNGQYIYINDYARSGKLDPGSHFADAAEAEATLKALDSAIGQSTTDKPETLYRGIGSGRNQVARGIKGEIKVGSVIQDPGYESWSTSRTTGLDYTNKPGSTMLEVELPAGSVGRRIEDDGLGEAELLRPRNSKYEVVSIRTEPYQGRDVRIATVRPVGDTPQTAESLRREIDAIDRKVDLARRSGVGSREHVALSAQRDALVEQRNAILEGRQVKQIESSGPPSLDEDEFEAFAKSWQPTLTADVKKAMELYTANGAYSHVNGPLRLGEGLQGVRTPELREAVPLLDAAIAKAPAPRDMIVYRGVSGRRSTKEWSDVGPGDVIVDRAFGSTSSMPHVGSSYAKGMDVRPGVELRVTIPKGYPAAPVPSEIFGAERELLLPRNTKYTVDKVVQHDKGRVIFVTASPAAEGEASVVAAVSRRKAKPIEELSLSELEDRMEAFDAARKKLERSAEGRASEEFKNARADYERAYKRQQEIKSGKVPEPRPELPVLDATPPTSAPIADDPLLSALRGTESKLASGADLGKLSRESPAAAEYATKKLAKREADAQFFRDKNTKPTGLEGVLDAQRLASADVKADDFFSQLTKPKTRDQYVAQNIGWAMREEGGHAAGLARLEREWAAMSGQPRTVADDVTSAADVITKYERAAAKLTEALGPEAPPAAQQAAKAFRDAEATVDRKTIERTTRAVDDHAEPPRSRGIKGGPTLGRSQPKPVFGDVPLPPSSREMLDAAKARRLDADAAFKRAKVSETEAKIGARQAQETADATRAAADAVRPVQPAAAAGESRLGALAVAAGVADFADILGIPGIPQPSDIPIIGPLLGLYLKFKALKYAAGRFTGRVAATGDSKAAALAARTKERIAEAVDRTLGLVEKAAPKSRALAVAATTQLNRRLFDDGEPDAPKNASVQELAAVRIREIAAAVIRPDLVQKQIAREFRGVTDPDLLAAAEAHLMARFEYLNRVSPKAPPPNPFSKREWKPSPMAAHDLAQRLSVINDPASAFVDPTPAKADTVKNVYPALLKMAQEWLIERVADTKHPVPYESRLRNSLLFDVPLDDSLQPDHAAVLATAHAPSPVTDAAAPQPGPPQASIAANTNISSVYRTGTERRAL